MENVKKIIKQEDGISAYMIKGNGHFVLQSQYMDAKTRLSNSSLNIEYGSFLTNISLYDATRTNMSKYGMLQQFYRVLSNVKTEQDLVELQAGLEELKSMGGIMSQLYPSLSASLQVDPATAKKFESMYTQAYQAEVAKVKNKNQTKTQEDEDAKQDVGSRDINNLADKTARTVENANGVDSALKDNYVMHIPEKTTDDLYIHMKRIKTVLKHYDNNKNQIYLDECRREIFHTFEEIKTAEELEAMNEFMEDLARQGESGREFLKQYEMVYAQYEDKMKARDSQLEEFDELFNRAMKSFDEFDEDRRMGRLNPEELEDNMSRMKHLEDLLEESKHHMTREQYVKYQEKIEERVRFMKRLQEQLEEIDNSMKLL